MTRKLRILAAILLSLGWISFVPAHSETLAEYNARLSAAQQAVTTAQSAVNTAQYNYDNNLIQQVSSSGSGLTAKVYNNTISMSPDEANLCATLNVSQINADWGGGSVLGCDPDNVTVHYFGTITVPDTGSYSFMNIADDGFYATINGQVVINEWVDKGCNGGWGSSIQLEANISYSIDAWFYENGGGACSTMYVTQPSGNWQVIPASWFGQTGAVSMIKDPALLLILEQKQSDLLSAQQTLSAIGPFVYPAINSPTNLSVVISGDNIILNWNAPTEGTMPERYAISWSTSPSNGWGIATGNVGDANALNTFITIPISVVNTDGLDKPYTFSIRSDNDTLHMYSANSNFVSIYINDPVRVAAEAAALAEQQRLAAEAAALAEQQRLAAIAAAEAARIAAEQAALAEQQRLAAIAEQQRLAAEAAVLAEQQRLAAIAAEAARLEAEAAAKLAAEQEAARLAAIEAAKIQAEKDKLAAEAAAKAEADRLAAEAAAIKAEQDRIAAELAAAKAEEERLAAEAAAIKAEEDARLAEEARLKAEAEAKAKAEEEARLEAERLAAEEAAIKAEAEAKAKAEEEARLEAERIAAEEAKAEAEANAKAKAEEEANKLAEQKAAEKAAKQAEEDKLAKIAEDAKAGKELSKEEVAAVVTALISDLKPGESISAAEIKASGVSYSDLPADTPVEIRVSESGEPLVITAEVAAQVELVQDPGALLQAAFTDPGAALAALGSIGADMTPGEREEATKMVVATVIATGAAMNAVGAATSTGGSTGGNSGGSGGGGGASSESKGVRRRKP